eukprot:gene3945-1028_t
MAKKKAAAPAAPKKKKSAAKKPPRKGKKKKKRKPRSRVQAQRVSPPPSRLDQLRELLLWGECAGVVSFSELRAITNRIQTGKRLGDKSPATKRRRIEPAPEAKRPRIQDVPKEEISQPAGGASKTHPGDKNYTTKKGDKDYHQSGHDVKKSTKPYSKGTGSRGGNLTQDLTKGLIWAVTHPREMSMIAQTAQRGAKAARKAITEIRNERLPGLYCINVPKCVKGYYKVGMSEGDIEKRLCQYAGVYPWGFHIVCLLLFPEGPLRYANVREAEKELLKHFKDQVIISYDGMKSSEWLRLHTKKQIADLRLQFELLAAKYDAKLTWFSD